MPATNEMQPALELAFSLETASGPPHGAPYPAPEILVFATLNAGSRMVRC
jgi:hypothetical protein